MAGLHFDCRLRYPDGFVLDATFEAGDGVTALFGPSGSGKTTILSLIAGGLRPDSGSIRLNGRVLADAHAGTFEAPERRRVGIVFQDQLLFPHLTIRQNLRFGQGRPLARAVDFNRVVEVLEISELLDRKPGTLSGGQRQRVALGRALLRGPELLLMDEPLAGLDEGLKGGVLDYLARAVAEWGLPTLLVSHNRADVQRLADRAVVIEGGRVVAAGRVGEVLSRRETPADLPAVGNLLRVTGLHQEGGRWQGLVGGQRLPLPAGDFEAGGSVAVQFLPGEVTLTDDASAPGVLGGVVRQVLAVGGRSLVAVDVGQFLWAELTPRTAQELGPRPGQRVGCLIRAESITVVG